MSLSHIIETTGAELAGAAYVGAFSSTEIAGASLAEGPQYAHCEKK